MAVSPGAAPHRDEAESAGQLAAVIEQAGGCLADLWDRDVPHLPASAAQLHVLLVVERHRDINLSGLAGHLGALVSSASRLCDRLEAAGLLHRAPGLTGRGVTLRLSHDGAALLDRLRRQRRDDIARVLACMPPGARSSLAAGLVQFRATAVNLGVVRFS
jgi:DNA-binding MarR family transcriptional regulator